MKQGLHRINKNLPAAVYLPFTSSKSRFLHTSLDAIRNYAVLAIAYKESRIFVTKTRAPYMIRVEVFRPHEEKIISESDHDQTWYKRGQTIKDIIIKSEKNMS